MNELICDAFAAGEGIPGAPRSSPASSPTRGNATREAGKQQPQANVGAGASLLGRAPQQNDAPEGSLDGRQSLEVANGTSRSKEVMGQSSRAQGFCSGR